MTGSPPLKPMRSQEWSLLLVLALLWGGSFFFYKILVAALPPFTVVLGRVGLAAVTLNLVLLARNERLSGGLVLWGRFALLGLLNNVLPFSAIAFGETRIASGLAAILNATTPIFTILVAHIMTHDEKLHSGKIIGIGAGFCGVAVLIGPSLFGSGTRGSLPGELACLAAPLSYALGAVYARRFKGTPPLRLATAQLTASTLIILPFSLLIDQPWLRPAPGLTIWAAFAGIALLSTALAFILFFRLLAVAGATNLSLVTLLLPVVALGLGALFLGESLHWYAFAGLGLIVAGLATIDGRPLAALRRLLNKSSSLAGSP